MADSDAGTARWAAIVVNYNAGPLLEKCVASLLADTSAGGPPRVVVVDNASTDRSASSLQRTFPDVTVLHAESNRGYASAANLGMAATTEPIVAVCNPDLTVDPGTGAALLGTFDNPRIGAAGPRIRNVDGSTYPSARRVPSVRDAVMHGVVGLAWPTNPFTRRYRNLDADPGVGREVDWVSGAAIWLRRAALAEVGGWDDDYFMYVEDVDLCWRLRRANWEIVYEPAGAVTHVQGVSTAQRPARMIVEHHRSLYRFAAKRWHGVRRLLLIPTAVYLAIRTGLVIAVGKLSGRRRMPRVRE